MAKKNPLKNIDVRETEFGTVYRIRILVKGKSYSATRDSLREAVEWRDTTKELLHKGETLPGEIPPGDMTLVDATNKFIMSSHGKAYATRKSYDWAQIQLLKYFDENTLLSEITPGKIHEYINHRINHDKVGGSKICQELSFIRLVYEMAPIWGVNLPSPEQSIKRPARRTSSREDRLSRVIQPVELVSFLNTCYEIDNSLYFFLIFLLYTGMRPSEAAGLRWSRLPAKELKLAQRNKEHVGYVDFDRGGMSMVGTKTETRFVPGHPVVMNLLRKLSELKPNEESLVWIPEHHGQKHVPYQYFRWRFRKVRNTTRLPDKSNLREDIDFYSFRHTARTRMAVCGIQDSAAEMIIGHADKEMQRTYTHYDDKDLIAQIARLEYLEFKLQPLI